MGGLRAIRRRTNAIRRRFTEKTRMRFGGGNFRNMASGHNNNDSSTTLGGCAVWQTDRDNDDDNDSSVFGADSTTGLLKRGGGGQKKRKSSMLDDAPACAWNEDDQILTLDPTRSSEGENSIGSMAIASVKILSTNFSDRTNHENGSIGDAIKKPSSKINNKTDPYRRNQSPIATQVIHPVICKRDIFIGDATALAPSSQPQQPPRQANVMSIVEPTTRAIEVYQPEAKRRSRDPSASYGHTTNRPDAPTGSLDSFDEASIGMPSSSISGSMLFSALENSSNDDAASSSSSFSVGASSKTKKTSDAKIKAGAAKVRKSLAMVKSPTGISNAATRRPIAHNSIMGSMLFRTLEEEDQSYKQPKGKNVKMNTIQETTQTSLVYRKKAIKFRDEYEVAKPSRVAGPKQEGGEGSRSSGDSLFDFQAEEIPQDIIKNSFSADGSCTHSSVSSITMYTSYSRASYGDPSVVQASTHLLDILRTNKNNNNNYGGEAEAYYDDIPLPPHLSEA